MWHSEGDMNHWIAELLYQLHHWPVLWTTWLAKVKTHHSLEIIKSFQEITYITRTHGKERIFPVRFAPCEQLWTLNITLTKQTWLSEYLLSVLSSFPRIMPPSSFLQLWRVAMTARTLRGYCTTWGPKSWCVQYHANHLPVLSGGYLTVFIVAGGSDQKGVHAGWDRGGGAAGGWRWRRGAQCISAQRRS